MELLNDLLSHQYADAVVVAVDVVDVLCVVAVVVVVDDVGDVLCVVVFVVVGGGGGVLLLLMLLLCYVVVVVAVVITNITMTLECYDLSSWVRISPGASGGMKSYTASRNLGSSRPGT